MPAVVFKLNPNQVALITMDLRSLMKSEVNWVYGEDWSISITVGEEVIPDDVEDPILMPE